MPPEPLIITVSRLAKSWVYLTASAFIFWIFDLVGGPTIVTVLNRVADEAVSQVPCLCLEDLILRTT